MCSGAHAGLLRWSSTGATQGIAAAGVRNWYNNFARRAWCRWGFPLNSFCNESLIRVPIVGFHKERAPVVGLR